MNGLVKYPLFVSLVFLVVSEAGPRYAQAGVGCMPGTYLVLEGSRTQSLWTLSRDRHMQITSSAEAALNFSHIQGVWKKTGSRAGKAAGLDFDFETDPGNGGVPPAGIARVDISIAFSKKCEKWREQWRLS